MYEYNKGRGAGLDLPCPDITHALKMLYLNFMFDLYTI